MAVRVVNTASYLSAYTGLHPRAQTLMDGALIGAFASDLGIAACCKPV